MSITLWKPEPNVLIHQALGKACEEASELANILARCLIQGLDQSEPVSGKSNRKALSDEIADLDAAVQWLRELTGEEYDEERADRKLNGFRQWQRMLEADMSAPSPAPNVMWPTEAICRLIHDHAGTKSPDEPLHHPAQKSWEEPTLVRWQQWEGLVEELHELVHAPAPQPRKRESPRLERLLAAAKAQIEKMTEAEIDAMLAAQRESWVRGMTTTCEHGVLDFEQCCDCRKTRPLSGDIT
ncbi:hypothetical protein C8J36_103569 [Rhizobium sp. PP-F2F-G48]|uniref:hypothetical protein n=1 Tax=Rhizobium sp. PP-F2F-G48 TaxID=2135651 RepID=UPI0010D27869|nr:hypothetical protein [Rhizobium sp. PP-F2F-G48]TCM56197.1 hypothetical protein C8J36_103569 [Rhizobium sp. PP-F2F-G48]